MKNDIAISDISALEGNEELLRSVEKALRMTSTHPRLMSQQRAIHFVQAALEAILTEKEAISRMACRYNTTSSLYVALTPRYIEATQ